MKRKTRKKIVKLASSVLAKRALAMAVAAVVGELVMRKLRYRYDARMTDEAVATRLNSPGFAEMGPV